MFIDETENERCIDEPRRDATQCFIRHTPSTAQNARPLERMNAALSQNCVVVVFVMNKGKACLLGGLLLLLLLLLGLTLVLFGGGGFWFRCFLLLLLLFLLLGDEEAEHLLCLDHVVLINVELAEHIVDLSLGHLVAPGSECVLEHLHVHLALDIVGFEGLDDQVVGVVAVTGHLLLEHLDHVVVGAGAADLAEQTIELALGHQDTDVVEGAVLVDVHELEAVLVHVKLLLGESSLILAFS